MRTLVFPKWLNLFGWWAAASLSVLIVGMNLLLRRARSARGRAQGEPGRAGEDREQLRIAREIR